MAAAIPFLDARRFSATRALMLMAAGALLGLAIAGYALFTAKGTRSNRVPPEAVALVNQRPILRSDFMAQAQAQYSKPFAATTPQQRRATLRDMIDEELLTQRGLEMDLPGYDPEVRNALVAGVELEISAQVLAQAPRSDELHAYYRAHADRYSSEGTMRLRDLVASTDRFGSIESAETAARAAASELRRGRSLDGVLGISHLADSGRLLAAGRPDTGDIFEFAARAKLGPALYAAAAALRDGEVSDAVRENDGAHIIVMLEHRPAAVRPFEQVSDRVWMDVKREAQARVKAAHLGYLRSRADILVSPELAP